MIPSRYRENNGPRPSPLKLNKVSLSIHKSSSNVFKHSRPPVIIYDHSPKVIHTRAEDFMALVQRLTGLSGPKNENPELPEIIQNNPNDESESSSVLTDETNGGTGVGDDRAGNVNMLTFTSHPIHYLADVPLFTPNSMALFGSPNRVFRYPDSALYLSSSDRIKSVSPSAFEFLKGLPEF